MKKTFNVLGINAGQGVCLYPFRKKPFKILGNVEPRAIFYSPGNPQWKANFGDIPMVRTLEDFPKPKQRVHLIIGHPDCGDNSVLRLSRAKKMGNSKTNSSVNLFIYSIIFYRPYIFVLENLPAFLKAYPKNELDKIFSNYTLIYHEMSVSAWGNSQVSRNRLVLVGLAKGHEGSYKNLRDVFPVTELFPSQHFEGGVEQAPEDGHIREPFEKLCNLYVPELGLRKVSYEFAQQFWSKYPQVSRWPVGGKMKNQPGVTRNILDDYPLTVRKQNRQFGTQGYVLSPREMANIQGVPTSFKIHVDLSKRVYWLNKSRASVTKCMPYQIALWVKKCILTTLRSQNLKHKRYGN